MSSWSKSTQRPFPTVMAGVRGHMSRNECCFLYDTPGRLGAGNYIEIGVLEGRSSVCIGDGIRYSGVDANLIAVDAFDLTDRLRKDNEGDIDGKRATRAYTVPGRFEAVQAMIKEKGLEDYITVVKRFSVDAAQDFQDKRFRFIFIDADHSYAGCKSDFDAWSPLLVSGGEIAFHDTDQESVQRVLDESGWEVVEGADTIGVIKKP